MKTVIIERQTLATASGNRPTLNSLSLRRASDGLEAVEKAQQLNPQLILMDIGLPKLDGLEAARRIRMLVRSSKIAFLTQETSAEVVNEALNLVARGYIIKHQART